MDLVSNKWLPSTLAGGKKKPGLMSPLTWDIHHNESMSGPASSIHREPPSINETCTSSKRLERNGDNSREKKEDPVPRWELTGISMFARAGLGERSFDFFHRLSEVLPASLLSR